jgi:hypothetical protein
MAGTRAFGFLSVVSVVAAIACAGRSMERGDDDGQAGAGARGGSASAGRGGSSGAGRGGGSSGSVGGSGLALGGFGPSVGGAAATGGTVPARGGSGSGPRAGSAGAIDEPIGGADSGGTAGIIEEPPIGGSGGQYDARFECINPREVEGGFVACESERGLPSLVAALGSVEYGYLHRPSAELCPVPARRIARESGAGGTTNDGDEKLASSGAPSGDSGNELTSCEDDADCVAPSLCTNASRNHCDISAEGGGGGAFGGTCQPGCDSDADCWGGTLCVCGSLLTRPERRGACVPATCRTNADCDDGYLCTSSYGPGYSIQFACQRPDDTCASHDDCEQNEGGASWGSNECTSGIRRTCRQVSCAG